MPVTGGSNVPALNYLLASWGIAFTDEVYEGDFLLGERAMHYATGTSLGTFPEDGYVFRTSLSDLGTEMIEGTTRTAARVPILGLVQTYKDEEDGENAIKGSSGITSGGRIAVYGDSNCLDNSHLQKDCFWFLDALLEYSMNSHLPKVFADNSGPVVGPSVDLPIRMENSNLHKHSKVSLLLI